MKYLTTLLTLFTLSVSAQQSDIIIDQDITKIAFGSCSRQEEADKQLWKEVNNQNPDLWLWLGDNVYSDGEDMEQRRQDFDLQKSHPDYLELLETTQIYGIWDDHDYGLNDGGNEYTKRDEAKKELFDFLDVPESHPAWSRDGAYQSYTFNGEQSIKVIFLDTRYFRDELKWANPGTSEKAAQVNPNGTVLGEDQWKWLESQLSDNVDVILLVSSIQALPEQHRFEKWANFPPERDQLLALLDQTETPVIILSGDRHMSEVSKKAKSNGDLIYELTSSSLTNPWGVAEDEPNKYRQGEIIFETNFSVMEFGREGIIVTYVGAGNSELAKYQIGLK